MRRFRGACSAVGRMWYDRSVREHRSDGHVVYGREHYLQLHPHPPADGNGDHGHAAPHFPPWDRRPDRWHTEWDGRLVHPSVDRLWDSVHTSVHGHCVDGRQDDVGHLLVAERRRVDIPLVGEALAYRRRSGVASREFVEDGDGCDGDTVHCVPIVFRLFRHSFELNLLTRGTSALSLRSPPRSRLRPSACLVGQVVAS